MSQSWRKKPDPFRQRTSKPMNIDAIWNSAGADDGTVVPPKQNSPAETPFNRLVHNLDRLNDLSETVAIDRGIVELIQRKTLPFKDQLTRQQVTLSLMGDPNVFTVTIWVIPIYSDGVMVHHLFAADDENQNLLREHRNPVKPTNYDITSL